MNDEELKAFERSEKLYEQHGALICMFLIGCLYTSGKNLEYSQVPELARYVSTNHLLGVKLSIAECEQLVGEAMDAVSKSVLSR